MRYYSIIVSDPKSGQVVTPPGFGNLLGPGPGGQGQTYGSYVNGQTIPGAWDVEMDVQVYQLDSPAGAGTIRVWGISVQEIGQALNLVGNNIAVYGGMQKGLPLAKPQQAGLLFKGWIVQAFGNWIETDMTLDLVVMPGPNTSGKAASASSLAASVIAGGSIGDDLAGAVPGPVAGAAPGANDGGLGTLTAPKNITLDWKAGTPFGEALRTTLQTAFPGYTVNVNTSANLVRPNDQIGVYPTLFELAQFARLASLGTMKKAGYAGVGITVDQQTITVSDLTAQPSSQQKMIAFEDMIGQPTWIEAPNIQVKTVMRADLKVWDQIKLPPALVTNTAAANSSLVNQQASFAGGFTVVNLRHVGRFRNPAADAWVTVVEGAPVNPPQPGVLNSPS